jgi:hypothetical protein
MKMLNPTLVRTVAGIALTTFLAAGMPSNAYAGMIGTDTVLHEATGSVRAEQLGKVEAMLSREDVQRRLVSLGVDPADALHRAAALSDADLARLSAKADDLHAGGDAGILALIGVVFVVLLILDYLDVVHVFHHRH